MPKDKDILAAYAKLLGKKGGKARAKKHGKTELSKWGKLGGRPRKDGKDKGKSDGR